MSATTKKEHDNTITIAEFEHKVRSTFNRINPQINTALIDTLNDQERYDALCMGFRAAIAGSVGLVSITFIIFVLQSLTNLDIVQEDSELLEKLHYIFGSAVPFDDIPAQEAHGILSRYISLDEEYTYHTQNFLKGYNLFQNLLRMQNVNSSNETDDSIRIFIKNNPDDFISFALLVLDVETFTHTYRLPEIVQYIVKYRFRDALNFYDHVKELYGNDSRHLEFAFEVSESKAEQKNNKEQDDGYVIL